MDKTTSGANLFITAEGMVGKKTKGGIDRNHPIADNDRYTNGFLAGYPYPPPKTPREAGLFLF
jgi:hypothetical protein